MMWPVSRAALSANASERLMTLATAKKDFQLDHPLSCNRSVLLQNKFNKQEQATLTTLKVNRENTQR